MTTHVMTSVTADNGASGSGTELRGWIQQCHDALDAVGLVQTSDTGQIDIPTVTNPASNGTAAGYEIWRFNDDLQATHPIYLKLEYGRGSNAARPGMWLTVGKGSDGSGTITDVLVPRNTLVGANTAIASMNGSGTGTGYAMYSDNGCCLAMIPFASGFSENARPGFIIERSRDDAGQATGDGLVFVPTGCPNGTLSPGSSGAAVGFCAVGYANPSSITWGFVPVVIPSVVAGTVMGGSASLAAGTIGPVFPWIAYVPGLAPWQCLTGMTYPAGDTPSGEFEVHNLGSPRNYRAIPIETGMCGFGLCMGIGSGGGTSSHNTYLGLALLWE